MWRKRKSVKQWTKFETCRISSVYCITPELCCNNNDVIMHPWLVLDLWHDLFCYCNDNCHTCGQLYLCPMTIHVCSYYFILWLSLKPLARLDFKLPNEWPKWKHCFQQYLTATGLDKEGKRVMRYLHEYIWRRSENVLSRNVSPWTHYTSDRSSLNNYC